MKLKADYQMHPNVRGARRPRRLNLSFSAPRRQRRNHTPDTLSLRCSPYLRSFSTSVVRRIPSRLAA